MSDRSPHFDAMELGYVYTLNAPLSPEYVLTSWEQGTHQFRLIHDVSSFKTVQYIKSPHIHYQEEDKTSFS